MGRPTCRHSPHSRFPLRGVAGLFSNRLFIANDLAWELISPFFGTPQLRIVLWPASK